MVLQYFSMRAQFLAVEEIPEDETVTIEGHLYKKGIRSSGYDWYLNHVTICCRDGEETVTVAVKRLLLRTEEDICPTGGSVRCTVEMQQLECASNEGSFDAVQYYHSLGISAVLYIETEDITLLSGSEDAPAERLFHLRTALRSVYEETLNGDDAGILAAMVLGDKSLMEQDVKDLYSSAGISHLLAVSGLHISVIGMSLYCFLRKRGAGYPAAAVLSGGAVWLFCIVSGMSVSAVRAGLMFAVYLGANVLGRKYDSLRALAAAAALNLLVNPYVILNAGFLFSYSAVIGAETIGALFKGPDKKSREEEKTKGPEAQNGMSAHTLQKKRSGTFLGSICSGMWMSAAILLVTLPLTAWFYYQIPVFGVLINVIVLPLAGVLLGFGILGGIAGLTALPFAWIFLLPCRVILRLFYIVCTLFSRIGGGCLITGRPGIGWLAAYYLLLALTVFALRRRNAGASLRWRRMRRLFFRILAECLASAAFFLFRGIRCFLLPAALLICMMLLPAPRQFEMVFLDVGQGDGIFISGGNGTYYFVDGGSSSESEAGRYRILPFLKYNRVRHIDIWFVSHADSDHISGLLEVLEAGYRIDRIVISEAMPKDDAYRELVAAAEANGTLVGEVSGGTVLTSGDLSMTFYTPGAEESGGSEEIEGEAEDRNEKSLVQLVEYEGYKFLLTGDIGEDEEEWLIAQPGIGTIDILKAAHHGSKYSSSEALLGAVCPAAVVISCSEDNIYGHPSPEAVARMEEAGCEIFETMESGQIRICIRGENLTAEVYKEEESR